MTTKFVRKVCARCGVAKKPGGRASSVLCPDCRYVLTEEERKVWMKPVAA